jgi:hypothetical protein
MFDTVYARSLVRHLPITVEQYDSGHLGFVARPTINGKRLNKSFSTSPASYGNLEDAAKAAIEFCRQKANEVQTERAEKRDSELERMIKLAESRGIDPVKAFHTGLMIHIKRGVQKELNGQ